MYNRSHASPLTTGANRLGTVVPASAGAVTKHAHCAKSALAAVAAFCATEGARAATAGFARAGFWEAGAALALAAASGAAAFAGAAFALRLENPLSRASLAW